jgi:hypothetical protein
MRINFDSKQDNFLPELDLIPIDELDLELEEALEEEKNFEKEALSSESESREAETHSGADSQSDSGGGRPSHSSDDTIIIYP